MWEWNKEPFYVNLIRNSERTTYTREGTSKCVFNAEKLQKKDAFCGSENSGYAYFYSQNTCISSSKVQIHKEFILGENTWSVIKLSF